MLRSARFACRRGSERIQSAVLYHDYHPSMSVVLAVAAVLLLLYLLNYLSYRVMKRRILERQTWDLNICCGKTDGGGVNADVVRHADVPNFIQVDIENLPFADKQFGTVLCSHTIEHVDDPERFFAELHRVGERGTIVLPPHWAVSAALK